MSVVGKHPIQTIKLRENRIMCKKRGAFIDEVVRVGIANNLAFKLF